jgi:hypothetical protein
VATNGTEANGDSGQPSITQEGRYIVFASIADNLVTGDTNHESDVFLHDRVAGTTRRLSVGAGGREFAGPSHSPQISANGSLLVFLTSGLNAAGPSAPGSMTDDASSVVVANEDDGKTTTGQVPLPTTETPPPAEVPPANTSSNDQEPNVSGDGSQTGHTNDPLPGAGNGGSSIDLEGPEPPEPGTEAAFVSGLRSSRGSRRRRGRRPAERRSTSKAATSSPMTGCCGTARCSPRPA